MKKTLVRVGFTLAVLAGATNGFVNMAASTHDLPQATKQYCC